MSFLVDVRIVNTHLHRMLSQVFSFIPIFMMKKCSPSIFAFMHLTIDLFSRDTIKLNLKFSIFGESKHMVRRIKVSGLVPTIIDLDKPVEDKLKWMAMRFN